MTTTASQVADDSLARNNARLSGDPLARPVVFGHSLGCDQTMWRHVAVHLEVDHLVVLFDHVGAGGSDRAAYRPSRYGSLLGYAEDLLTLLDQLALGPAVFVGHSAAAMIGVLAAVRRPDLFSALVLVGGSPRYLDDEGYSGGFSRYDVDGVLGAMDSDHVGWSRSFAPLVMGNPDRPHLAEELTARFLHTDRRVAGDFARAVFLSDHRNEVAHVRTPTLVVQAAEDPIVPTAVGEYLHRRIRGSRYAALRTTGHFPPLSGPEEVTAVIRDFLAGVPR